HSLTITTIYFFESGNLTELVNHLVGTAFNGLATPASASAQFYQSGGNDLVTDLIQYVFGAMGVGCLVGFSFARAAAYGWWPFDLIGRLYYGGLYGAYRGFLSKEVWVAVLSKEKVDGKNIIYSGVLEELKLKSSGQIDYATISKPYKAVVSISELNNENRPKSMKSGKPVLMGNSISSLITEPNEDQDLEMLLQFSSNRLMIEGEDIANVHLERQDTRSTFESFLMLKVFLNDRAKLRQTPLVFIVIAIFIGIAISLTN
ncbi:MAG: hypothetical protein VX501_10810, partial [Pseudomonadota bacterium]|nr:hypothetical protein [Pseudomonadota bacterium]